MLRSRSMPVVVCVLALLCVWLMMAGTAVAQSSLVVRHFGTAEGLPVSSASHIAIDADGFLWLATHDGLARFDGREFRVYDVAQTSAVGSNRITALYADAHRQVYAYGAGGEWLQVGSQQIRRIRMDAADPEARVRHVHPDPLCVTLPAGLYCAEATGMRLRRAFTQGQEVRLAIPAGAADWLLVQGVGVQYCVGPNCHTVWANSRLQVPLDARQALVQPDSLWLALPEGLLQVYPDAPAQWRLHTGKEVFDLQRMTAEADGSLLVGSGRGFWRIQAGQLLPALPDSVQDALWQGWRAPDGALWHSRDHELFRAGERVLAARGKITSVLFEPGGTVFAATLRDGLYAIGQPRVELVGSDLSLESSNIYGVSLDVAGGAWLGSLGEGLIRLWPDGRLQVFGAAQGLGEYAWAVQATPDEVLAAPYGGGLWQLDASGQRFVPAPVPAALGSARTRAFSIDPDGRLWLGGTAGVWRRDGAHWSRQWSRGSAAVLAIAHGADGVVWYGGEAGLWRDHAGDVHEVAAELLQDAVVRGLLLASDGALWASSEGRGLIRVAADDPRGLRARRLGRTEGLPSNSPHAVVEDPLHGGDLWVNSNQGIFRISRLALEELLAGRSSVLSPLTLGLADGLSELEGNGGVQPAAAVDAQGRIWFPSQRGVVRVDPGALSLRTRAPRAVIDGLTSDGALLQAAQLPLGLRSLQVHYNAAELRAGSAVRFRHRLIPGDPVWREVGEQRVASFTALPAGRHRFEVLAGNSDGYWAQQPAVLEFDVPARWTETRSFQLGLMVAAVLSILLLAQVRMRLLRRQAMQLDQQVRTRTHELSTQKQRAETALQELGEAHSELALTHDQIASRNRKLAEQTRRLEQLDQFRSRLLADVSHELRTPLMLIKLPLQELLERSGPLGRAERQRLQLPLAQTERLSHLVEQLVGLVQAEAGQLPLRMQRLELVRWVAGVLDSFRPMAQQQDIGLQLQSSCGQLWLYADPEHLATILGNLVDNALKYAPPSSTVTLSIQRQPDDMAQVRVIDHGVGFPPEVAASLFERFFRVAGPPRQGREGLGIGLALARELAELHGGRVGAEMVPGGGTHFWFQLPLGSAHVELAELSLSETRAEAAPAAPSAVVENDGILLVEDHPELAAYLCERLSERFAVTVMGSVESAWQCLQRHSFRLLVCDVVLPGMDGISWCRQLRADPRWSALPIILISAKSTRPDRQSGLDAGASSWLAKPFAFAELLQEIERLWPDGKSTGVIAATAGDGLDAILQMALQHLSDPGFGVAQWSVAVHLSDRQLRRRVTELSGMSPLNWLREQRLLKVHELIGTGRCQTLAAAGAEAGLDNPGYLYRLYRARFGES